MNLSVLFPLLPLSALAMLLLIVWYLIAPGRGKPLRIERRDPAQPDVRAEPTPARREFARSETYTPGR